MNKSLIGRRKSRKKTSPGNKSSRHVSLAASVQSLNKGISNLNPFGSANKYAYLKAISSKSDVSIINKIVRDLRADQKDESFQGAAFIAIYNLAREPLNRVIIFENGAMPLVVSAMKRHSRNEPVLEAACAAIAFICKIETFPLGLLQPQEPSTIAKQSHFIGATERVAYCLRTFPKNKSLQDVACLAISSLARCHLVARCLISEFKVAFYMSRTMTAHMDSPGTLHSVCDAIISLSSHQYFSSSGEVDDATAALLELNSSSEVTDKLNIVESFWRVEIALKILSAMIRYPLQQELQEAGLGVLLGLKHPVGMSLMGGCEILLAAMKTHGPNSLRIVDLGFRLIKNYANYPSICQKLMDKGVAETVLRIIDLPNFAENNIVISGGCYSFWTLSFWDENKPKIVKLKIDEVMVRIIEDPEKQADFRVVEAACGVLANLSTISSNATRYLETKVHKAVINAALKHSDVEGVLISTVSLLRNLSYFDETRLLPLCGSTSLLEAARDQFVGNGFIEEAATEILQRYAPPPILELASPAAPFVLGKHRAQSSASTSSDIGPIPDFI